LTTTTGDNSPRKGSDTDSIESEEENESESDAGEEETSSNSSDVSPVITNPAIPTGQSNLVDIGQSEIDESSSTNQNTKNPRKGIFKFVKRPNSASARSKSEETISERFRAN
jgi:hypothetical protein